MLPKMFALAIRNYLLEMTERNYGCHLLCQYFLSEEYMPCNTPKYYYTEYTELYTETVFPFFLYE